MSVTEAIEQIATELLAIRVPIFLKEDITEPIENAVLKLKGLQDAVEKLHQRDEEEKQNLRNINQELAEKAFGKPAEVPRTDE